MTPLLTYALQSAACMGLFWAVYKLILDRRAGFAACRFFLIFSLFASVIIPLLKIGILPAKAAEQFPATFPLTSTQEVIEEISTSGSTGPASESLIVALYFLIGCTLLIYSAVQLHSIIRLKRGGEIEFKEGYRIIENLNIKSPFSFFTDIFLNPRIEGQDRKAVIDHERSHIRHGHSYDKIIVGLIKTTLWFNPFVWLACKSLSQVHEYQADRDVIDGGCSPELYGQTLFRQTFGCNPELANGLSGSLTKNRLIMMTSKITSRKSLLRTMAIIPVTILLLSIFSFTHKTGDGEQVAQTPDGPVFFVNGQRFEGTLGDINPNTIERMEIWKDSIPDYLRLRINLQSAEKGIVMITLKKGENNSLISCQGEVITKGEPVYRIDGTVVPAGIVQALDPDKIEELRMYGQEDELTRMGFPDAMGLIDVTLKKQDK